MLKIILHKKDHPKRMVLANWRVCRLCTFDVSCFQALRANISALHLAVELDRDLLDIRAESTIRDTMRMADVTTSAGCFTADLTYFGHS